MPELTPEQWAERIKAVLADPDAVITHSEIRPTGEAIGG